MSVSHNVKKARRVVATLYRSLRELAPSRRAARRFNNARRDAGLKRLDRLSREAAPEPTLRRVLVDGQWDNANYWFRYAMFRNALGLAGSEEIGLTGRYSRDRSATAFAAFGIKRVLNHGSHYEQRGAFLEQARSLLTGAHRAGDILGWKLPEDFPAVMVYDGILKRQRRADVDMTDPALPDMVAEALSAIDAARSVIDRERPDLVVLSHAIDFSYGSLAWVASRRGIPVVVLYGDYGVNRFMRLHKPEDIFGYPTRPTLADAAALSPGAQDELTKAGRRLLGDRMGGKTADVSAVFAYRRRLEHVDRPLLAERYGWDVAKPVIAIYVPNWFDYPNGSGRFPFRDFREWAELTLQVAVDHPQFNWMFKAHPCDEWYGRINGARIADMVDAAAVPHVRVCDSQWNGRAILEAVDGIVTVHGTVGLEAPSVGTPVLVPYAGWYGDFGFVEVTKSVDDYRRELGSRWWEKVDTTLAEQGAAAFAGWYFSAPAWHDGWFLADDSNQDVIWWDIEVEIEKHRTAIDREISEMRAWISDGHKYFMAFKLLRAGGFVPAYPRQPVSAAANSDPRKTQLLGERAA